MTASQLHLSASGLLSTIRQRFTRVPDGRTGSTSVSLPDALMSGLAMFGLKCPSLLQFDQQRRDPMVKYNLQTLYGVEQVPCDTQMRTILDPVDPMELRPAFQAAFVQAQRGKVLEDYVFLNGRYLMALDGTHFFASSAVSCPHGGVKHLPGRWPART